MFSGVDGGLPDGALTLEQLGSRIVALSGRLAAATCRWLLLVGEFDAREGGEYKLGFASAAHRLQYSRALAHRTAVEHVRIARAVRAWPRLAQEMSAGRLSYSQVRAISRVATGPAGESMATAELAVDLIVAAQHESAARLETLVRGLRIVHGNETAPLPRAERERVSRSWTAGSQWALSARLDPERGEVVRSALAAVAKAADLWRRTRWCGWPRSGSLPSLTAAPGPWPVRSRPRSSSTSTPPASRSGPNRLVTRRQFLALKIRDGSSRAYQGCRNRAGLEAHHVQHWLRCGRTDLDNLILLCQMHHLAHHHGEYEIHRPGHGRFRFRGDGTELPHWIDPSELATQPGPIEYEHPVAIDAATPSWDGTRMDHDWAITTAAQHLNLPESA